jgi:insertion element IS1 protein InsB
LGFEIGDRSETTCEKLYNKIKGISARIYYTDHLKAYNCILPDNKHISSKAETYTIEKLNGCIRHFLARFHRKSYCYSKSIEMIIYSLNLLFHKRNNKCILNYH